VAGKPLLNRWAGLLLMTLRLVIRGRRFHTLAVTFIVRRYRQALKKIEEICARIDLGLGCGFIGRMGHGFSYLVLNFQGPCSTTVRQAHLRILFKKEHSREILECRSLMS
jgi:hypothetical protein